MTGAWHGGRPGADQYVKNAEIRSTISRAMQYWFDRDFTNADCLDAGGTTSCPCGTAGLWYVPVFAARATPELIN